MTSKREDGKAFAERQLAHARGSYTRDHTLSVFTPCMHGGRAHGADLEVLDIGAYVHALMEDF